MPLGRTSRFRSLTVFLGLVSLAAPRPAASAESFDIVSFEVPQGWTLQRQDTGDRVMLKRTEEDKFCLVTMFSSAPSTQDAQADYAAEWKRIVVAMSPNMPPPKPVPHRLASGLDSLGARAKLQVSGTPVHARLLVVAAGAKHVPILFLATSREVLDGYQQPVDQFLNSLAVQGGAPQAGSSPPGQILLSELAGTWGVNDSDTTTYVSASTGQYAGSSTVSTRETYVLKPDLTYTSHFSGYTDGRTVQEEDAGTYGFENNLLVLQSNCGKAPKRYKIIDWKRESDRVVKIRLLDDSYPATESNINLYAENWIRAPK
jgi:hypothetical protein